MSDAGGPESGHGGAQRPSRGAQLDAREKAFGDGDRRWGGTPCLTRGSRHLRHVFHRPAKPQSAPNPGLSAVQGRAVVEKPAPFRSSYRRSSNLAICSVWFMSGSHSQITPCSLMTTAGLFPSDGSLTYLSPSRADMPNSIPTRRSGSFRTANGSCSFSTHWRAASKLPSWIPNSTTFFSVNLAACSRYPRAMRVQLPPPGFVKKYSRTFCPRRLPRDIVCPSLD